MLCCMGVFGMFASCSVYGFKHTLDSYLMNIVDHPYLLLVGSQVLTRCPPLFVVHGVHAVVESRSSREIDNIPQI